MCVLRRRSFEVSVSAYSITKKFWQNVDLPEGYNPSVTRLIILELILCISCKCGYGRSDKPQSGGLVLPVVASYRRTSVSAEHSASEYKPALKTHDEFPSS